MIRDLLKSLSPTDYKQLRYAHENDIAQYIVLDGGIFVGVHVEPLSNLEILEQVGAWSYGKVISESAN